MAFVNELIPEEQKAQFTFPVSTRADGSKPTLWKWTIDRERNAFLVQVGKEGGAYEGTPETEHYTLNWMGELVHFYGDPVVTGNATNGNVMSWRIHHLVVPPALAGRLDDVLRVIREALDAMGWLYRRERVTAVNVDFDLSSLR